MDPTEWAVVIHRRTYVVIRRVELHGEDFWRVVTGEDDRSKRRLIGYWGTFEEATHNALAWVERQLPPAWLATGTSTFVRPREMTPQKPPPDRSVQTSSIPRGVDTVWGAARR